MFQLHLPTDPPVEGLPLWPHAVIITRPGATSKEIAASGKEEMTKLLDRNRQLKKLGLYESVLLPDFVAEILSNSHTRNNFWKCVKGCKHIVWILIGNPTQLLALLPDDWGDGYPNVVVALSAIGSAEQNEASVAALGRLQARCKALWIDPETYRPLVNAKVDWWIIDASRLPEARVEGLRGWIETTAKYCEENKTPLFCNYSCAEGSQAPALGEGPHRQHPFDYDLDLRVFRHLAAPPEVTTGETTAPAATTQNPPVCAYDGSSPLEALVLPSKSVVVGRFKQLHEVVRTGLQHFCEAGIALAEIRDNELWREGGYSSWDSYCSDCGMSKNYSNRLIKSASTAISLNSKGKRSAGTGGPILPLHESQVRPLTKLETSEREKAWKLSVKRAGGMPTAKIVADVVCEVLTGGSVKPPISRQERRKQLGEQLIEAVEAAQSWDLVRELVSKLVPLI